MAFTQRQMDWFRANDELGDLYAEAKALGADDFILETKRRSDKFIETKKNSIISDR